MHRAGTWKFEDATHVVTDQEVTDQTKFELTFLPADNKKIQNCYYVGSGKNSE